METAKEFIEHMVTIDEQGDDHGYGHYPFQMVVIKAEKKMEICALALSTIMDYYTVAKKWVVQNPIKLFISIDFPKMGDMDRDFVAVYSIIEGEYEVCAIPYDRETGKTYPIVEGKDSPKLQELVQQFKHCVALTDAEKVKLN
jgi:hypothetical protein